MERPTRELTLELISSKEKMEKELKALMEVLESNDTDMSQSLVDDEGYPRADIDVYQVRTARHRIICLTNDLKDITKKIENALHSLHAQQREGLGPASSSILGDFQEESLPFAKIGDVNEGSPASEAGLKSGDLVLGFGSLTSSSFNSLQDIVQIVQHSILRDIPLVVKRTDRLIPIKLIPHTWSGKGVLGCVLLPYDNVDR